MIYYCRNCKTYDRLVLWHLISFDFDLIYVWIHKNTPIHGQLCNTTGRFAECVGHLKDKCGNLRPKPTMNDPTSKFCLC